MANIEDFRTRKWNLTINNPLDKGLTREVIKEIVSEFKNVLYWCISDEIGAGGTPHVHMFIVFSNARSFSTLKNKFPTAHLEACRGTNKQNRDYVFKEGKLSGSDKEETNIKDSHEEFGELPLERQGKRSDLDDLYDMVQSGMSAQQIIEENPTYMLRRQQIEELIFDKHRKTFGNTFRDMNVTYAYGVSGSGKTSDIVKEFGYSNIYRVVDYSHPFDSYSGQDVIVFEEYRSQFHISTLLNMIDGHPFDLPCRYHNKVACYTKVFFTSNIPLKELYVNVQQREEETFRALLRRIHQIKIYDAEGVRVMKTQKYVNENMILFRQPDPDGWIHVPEGVQTELPF